MRTLAVGWTSLLWLAHLFGAAVVVASPPLEYFLYTSNTFKKPPEASGSDQVSLPSIESLYAHAGDPKLAARVLELIKNTSHTHDNDRTDLRSSQLAWHLMEQQALTYMQNKVKHLEPYARKLIEEAQVSDDCSQALRGWLFALTKLDYWASLMWNSWGEFPPSGLFEGSFTGFGSYRGCMRVKDNDIIGQAQYCSLDFQPLVPTRPRFHSIFKQVLGYDPKRKLLTLGDFDSLEQLSSKHSAHEFASTKFKNLMSNLTWSLSSTSSSPSDSSNSIEMVKLNSKRTITTSSNSNSSPSEDADSTSGELMANSTRDSNLTIGAQALVELAKRAQYFYYVKFRLGTCLPSRCSADDVQKLANLAGQRTILQASEVSCMKREPSKLNNHQKFAIFVLSSFAFVACLGTIIDILGFKADPNGNSPAKWLLLFSVLTNGRKLFSKAPDSSHQDLECVHGLRFFSMIWVIYGHTILYTQYQGYTHFFDVVENKISSMMLLPTLNANFSVDTFFVISGILTTYVTWEYTKGDPRKFNLFAFGISRYIRLTPQLAIVMLCFFLLPLFGEGPLYKQVTEPEASLCFDKWPLNLLYLQTYTDSEKICIDPSWWLSIEMTFHLVSIFIIFVLIRSPKHGMILNFGIAATLTVIGALIHYFNGFAVQYLPSIPQRYEIQSQQTLMFFHKPYPHAASYFIGTALGYVLANRTVKPMSRWQLFQGWVGCISGLVVSLCGSYFWNLGAPYTQLQATLYYHVCQILWPLSVSWIILTCSLGQGGPVMSLLSAKCFAPLGRITYMTYLSHALVIYYHSACLSMPLEPSMLLFVYLFIANTILALILGTLLTVVFESPILNLQKFLFAYLMNKYDATTSNTNNSTAKPMLNRRPKGTSDPEDGPTLLICDKTNANVNGTSSSQPNDRHHHQLIMQQYPYRDAEPDQA